VSFACETLFSAISRNAAGISIFGISKFGSSNFGISNAAGVSLALDFDVSIDSVMNGSFGGVDPAARGSAPTADPRLADNGSVAATPTRNATARADPGTYSRGLGAMQQNTAAHNQVMVAAAFSGVLRLGPGQRLRAASRAALVVLSPSSRACSVN